MCMSVGEGATRVRVSSETAANTPPPSFLPLSFPNPLFSLGGRGKQLILFYVLWAWGWRQDFAHFRQALFA